ALAPGARGARAGADDELSTAATALGRHTRLSRSESGNQLATRHPGALPQGGGRFPGLRSESCPSPRLVYGGRCSRQGAVAASPLSAARPRPKSAGGSARGRLGTLFPAFLELAAPLLALILKDRAQVV